MTVQCFRGGLGLTCSGRILTGVLGQERHARIALLKSEAENCPVLIVGLDLSGDVTVEKSGAS